MKVSIYRLAVLLISGYCFYSCASNPYAVSNKSYKKQAKVLAKSLRQVPVLTPGADSLLMGDIWVGTTNFNIRKPNYVVIHHTAQSSTSQTLKTFTQPNTQVSAHYVIDRNGKIYHMLNDYLRAWHAGAGKWGNNTDINSSSIGIELDNNGAEPFAEPQISSLIKLLAILKKTYVIPAANFIGHADIAPTRKADPNATFPWQRLAEQGFGLWYDPEVVQTNTAADPATLPILPFVADTTLNPVDSLISTNGLSPGFYPAEALRIIGYDTRDLGAAIKSFKLHFIQTQIDTQLSDFDKRVLFNLYKKYL